MALSSPHNTYERIKRQANACVRHSGARALARKPGIHNPRLAVIDSGLAASRRPGMTRLGLSVSASTLGVGWGGFCGNELILEFPTKSMPPGFRAAPCHMQLHEVRSYARLGHSGAPPKVASPESIALGQWL